MAQSSTQVIALCIVFSVLAVGFAGLRWWARRIKDLELMMDDFLVFAATILFVIFLVVPLIIMCVRSGLGDHVQTNEDGEPFPPSYLYNLCLLIFTTSACVPIVITKCSILFFYRRIFRGTAFSIVNWTTLGLVVAWMIAFFFAILFSCTPIGKSLENYPHPVVKCIDQDTLFYVGAGSDIAIDFIILFIPWPFIWKLQMSTKNKIAVTSIFFLGILTIASGIARLAEFTNSSKILNEGDPDYTYFTAPALYWTMLESALAIVSACLPTLKPLFHGWSSKSSRDSRDGRLPLQSRHSSDWQYKKAPTITYHSKLSESSITPLHPRSPPAAYKTVVAAAGRIQPMELPAMPSDRIMVHKGWSRYDSNV